jgi:hypothetical protein
VLESGECFHRKKPLLHIENALGLGESIIQRINLFSSSSHNTFNFTKRRKKALPLKIALNDSRAFSFEKHFIQEPSCFEWIQKIIFSKVIENLSQWERAFV